MRRRREIDSNDGKTGNSIKSWLNADFNYHGRIDADDCVLIDAAYQGQFATAAQVAAVPEPGGVCAALLAVGALAMRCWR